MPTHYQDSTLTCDTCAATTPRPADGQYRPLWDAGWRWKYAAEKSHRFVSDHELIACPKCPSLYSEEYERKHGFTRPHAQH